MTALLLALAVAFADPAPGVAPSWVEAHYRASFRNEGLRGEATWRAWPPRPGARVPLAPLSVALTPGDARLVPTLTGSAAVLPLGGTVHVEFSARPSPEPGADRFELQLPAAPVATLELELPADRTLEAPGSLVDEPYPSAQGKKTWRVAFGGRSHLELVILRQSRRGDPPPLARASVKTSVELSAGVAAVTAVVLLDPIRGPVRLASLKLDPRLSVTAVTGPGGPTWSLSGSELRVRAETGSLTRFAVAATAAYTPGAGGWPVPGVVVDGTLPGAESVEVIAGPDLAWRGLATGGYRITDARSATLLGFERGYRVTLARDFSRPAGSAIVHTEAVGPGFATFEDISWRLGGGFARADIRLRLSVTRGPLARLKLQLPVGFALTSVTSASDAGLVVERGPKGAQFVYPSRPLATGQAVEWRIQLRGRGPIAGHDFRPPDLVAVGAADREGSVAILAPPGFALLPSGMGTRTPFRAHPPRVAVTLVSAPGDVVEDRDFSVRDGPRGWAATTTLQVRAAELPPVLVGLPRGDWSVEIGPRDGSAVSVTAELAIARRLALAAGLLPNLGAIPPRFAEVWRLTPVAGASELTARFTQRLAAPASPSVLRLPLTLGAVHIPPSARLTPDLAAGWVAEPDGGSVTFHPRRAESPAGDWLLTDTRRSIDLTRSQARVTLRFTVAARPAGQFRLPVRLPENAEWREAHVAGKVVAVTERESELSIPAGEAVPVMLAYDFPSPDWGPVVRLPTPVELIPGLGFVPTETGCHAAFRPWPTLDDSGLTLPAPKWAIRVDWLRALGGGIGLLLLAAAVAGRGTRLALGIGLIFAALTLALPPGWGVLLIPGAIAGLMILTSRALLPLLPREPDPVVILTPRLSSTVTVLRATAGASSLLLLLAVANGQTPDAPAIADAEYEFDASDPTAGTLRGVAQFRVETSRPGRVFIPLDGARLDGAMRDGVPFTPAATVGGYAVDLGIGRHEVAFSFALPLKSSGPEREARLLGPPLPTARVTLRCPPHSESPDIPSRRGIQTRLAGERPGVRADHGSGPIVVRWSAAPDGRAGEPAAAATEITAWDASESGATGIAVVVVRPEGGRLTGVTLVLPPRVELGEPRVTSAEGRAIDGLPAIAELRQPPGGHRLRVSFREPVATRFALVIPLAMPPPPPGEAAPYPAVTVESPIPGDGYLVVRGAGALAPPERRRLIDFPTEEVARRFAGFPELEFATRPAERAFQILPGPGRVELHAAPFPLVLAPSPNVELTWTVGESADYAATVALTWDTPTGFVELPWLDEFPVADVRAPGLTAWERVPGAVRLWLRRPAREVAVRVAGSLAAPGGMAPLPKLPSGSVSVRAAAGWETVGTPDPSGRVQVHRALPSLPPVVPPVVRPLASPPTTPNPPMPTPTATAAMPPLSDAPTPGIALAVVWALAAGVYMIAAHALPRRERLAWLAGLIAALGLQPAIAIACGFAAVGLRFARRRG